MMTSMAVVLLALAAKVDLSVTARQTDFLPGEPIRLDVVGVARERVEVQPETSDFCNRTARLVVEGTAGSAVYFEEAHVFCEGIYGPRTLQPGERWESRLVFFGTGGYVPGSITSTDVRRGWVFEQPGRFTISLAQLTKSGEAIRSNRIDVTVNAPSEKDLPAWSALREDPRRMVVIPWALALAERFPDSRCLAIHRLGLLRVKASRLREASDVSSRESEIREVVEEALTRSWGQFEDDALVFAFMTASSPALLDLRQRAEKRLRAKYLDSEWIRGLLRTPETKATRPGVKADEPAPE